MADAGPMLLACFQHQHPEVYGRPEILPEFPREASVSSEAIPDGMNREGCVFPDVVTT